MNTLASPFSNITEPTTVRRVLLREGMLDMADDLPLDGWAFHMKKHGLPNNENVLDSTIYRCGLDYMRQLQQFQGGVKP